MSAVAYSIEDAASACGFSVRTLRGAIASGELVAHRRSAKSNSKFVILRADLETWIESLPFAGDAEKTA